MGKTTADTSITDHMTVRQLRGKLGEQLISREALAQAAKMDAADLSSILREHTYLGEARRARLADAIRQLGLDQPLE